MKNIIALLSFFVCTPALAGDLYLDINGYSRHSNDTYVYKGQVHEFNSNNLGLGLTYGVNKYVEAFAGFYDNSFNKTTLYGGAKLKLDFNIADVTITPGLNVGAATGYADTPAMSDYYQVVVMPTVRVTYRGVGLTIGYVPIVERENFVSVSTVTAQINIRIGRR